MQSRDAENQEEQKKMKKKSERMKMKKEICVSAGVDKCCWMKKRSLNLFSCWQDYLAMKSGPLFFLKRIQIFTFKLFRLIRKKIIFMHLFILYKTFRQKFYQFYLSAFFFFPFHIFLQPFIHFIKRNV